MEPTAKHLVKGLERRAQQGFQGYPLGIVAYYGPNDRTATKSIIGIVKEQGSKPDLLKEWNAPEDDVRNSVETLKEMFRYLEANEVLSVALSPGVYGCPHEEGVDYPAGESCPKCPFWGKNKKPDLFQRNKK